MRKVLNIWIILILFSVSAQAQLIRTDTILAGHENASQRDKVMAFMERDDVIGQFEKLGVAPETARMQVALLTDEEIDKLSHSIDAMPAGGDILGIALFVFLVLLITDIFGLTKVFPFTKPIR